MLVKRDMLKYANDVNRHGWGISDHPELQCKVTLVIIRMKRKEEYVKSLDSKIVE